MEHRILFFSIFIACSKFSLKFQNLFQNLCQPCWERTSTQQTVPFMFLAWETLWRSVHADQRWKARQARLWRRMQRTLVNSFVQKSVHGFCTLVRMPARRTLVIHSFIHLKNKSPTNVWRSCVR